MLFMICFKNLCSGGRKGTSLGHLRKVKFTEMSLRSKKIIQPEQLPPSAGAAKQHAFRVFLQVSYWKTLMRTSMKPDDWGWRLNKDGLLEPVMTEEVNAFRQFKLAPLSLLFSIALRLFMWFIVAQLKDKLMRSFADYLVKYTWHSFIVIKIMQRTC